MYTGFDIGLTETYMMPGTGPNPPMTLLPPPEAVDFLASEVAPEVIYDQGSYYPAANYYGYFCTGFEPQSEWDDQHSFFGFDGQEFHYPALQPQRENSAYVYYPPSYGYAQSSYNPYLPGAVMGFDGPVTGAEQYFPNPSYNLPDSSPTAYVPLVVQPGSDAVPNFSASIRSGQGGVGSKHSHSRVSSNGRATSQGAASRIPKSELLQTDGMTSGNVTQLTQVSSSNLLPNFGSNVHGWASVDRSRSRFQTSGVLKNGNGSTAILGEQNRGPRTNKAKGQWSSAISDGTRMSTTDANARGAIVICADQYNRDDFPVDYPDAKFFVIKSYSEDDVHKSIKYNVWSSTPNGNKRLNNAYEEEQRISFEKSWKCPIFLFFSVNASGQFCGVAEMIGPVDFDKDMDFWQQDKWTGSFPLKWHIMKDVPNTSFRHIILENNENKPVTNSRDTQEITYVPGMAMLNIFKSSPLKTSILDDFMFYEERQKIMQEEKSRFTGRNCIPYAPTFILTDKPNDLAKQTNSKEDGAHSNATLELPLKADGLEPDAIKASDDEKDIDAEKKGDAKNAVIGMKSLSIEDKNAVKDAVVADDSTEGDVVTVGSMPIKVNGTVESKTAEPEVSSEK